MRPGRSPGRRSPRSLSARAARSCRRLRVLRGRVDDGLAALDRLLGETPEDAVAHAWQAEALLRMRRPVVARLAADRAMMCSRGYRLPGPGAPLPGPRR